MSTFYRKLQTFFREKHKIVEFALSFVNVIAEIRLRFDLTRKFRSVITELRCASTKLKSSLRKLRCASENKKIKLRVLRGAISNLKNDLRFNFWNRYDF